MWKGWIVQYVYVNFLENANFAKCKVVGPFSIPSSSVWEFQLLYILGVGLSNFTMSV